MSDGRQHRYFQFENGVTVELIGVPPATIQSFEASFRATEPKPPKQQVDYGQGPVWEDNPSHPDYQKAVEKHALAMAQKVMDFILYKGIKVEVDPAALAEAREAAALFGATVDEANDKLAYIKHVLIGSNDELVRLREAILTRKQPTEAAIAEASERFKS